MITPLKQLLQVKKTTPTPFLFTIKAKFILNTIILLSLLKKFD